MTFIRMMDGRDRGHVKEMPFDEAQTMLGNGQAVLVNFNEPDPLGYREMPPEKAASSSSLTATSQKPEAGLALKPAGGLEPLPRPAKAISTPRGGPAARFKSGSR